MYIIPAIDLIDGKCVRLTQGDYAQKKVYNENPLEVAKMFEDAGIQRLHLVDLDGAKAKKIVNHAVLRDIATHTNLVIDFGGGLQSDEDLKIAFDNGASMITGGSIAVKNRPMFEAWLQQFGADKIILGADAKDGFIAVSGWQDTTELPLLSFIQDYQQIGVRKVISTDIAKDGLMAGPSFDLYGDILAQCAGIEIIASGGVTTLHDLNELKAMGVHGAIVGKALYEGSIQLKDLGLFLN
jgi:phosphoribosylformimino-5-aminoimidazole carboxamide ribotide isomerase